VFPMTGPEGLAGGGASAVLRGLAVEPALGVAARLAAAPSPWPGGSRGTLGQAPGIVEINVYPQRNRNSITQTALGRSLE
jgi:hypothetical protein